MTALGNTRIRRPLTVIYADPDPAARRRTVGELESVADELAVDPVATPSELRAALAAADERVCAVTEYRFGETDALSLYEGLRADGSAAVPFVLYTADGDETLASDAVTTGLSGYVPKGLGDSIDRLAAQVSTIIEGSDPPSDDGFAIADDGLGVPPAERDDILESGYSTSSEGTGFGLAIVSEVVDAHGWSIETGASEAGGLRLAVSLEE